MGAVDFSEWGTCDVCDQHRPLNADMLICSQCFQEGDYMRDYELDDLHTIYPAEAELDELSFVLYQREQGSL